MADPKPSPNVIKGLLISAALFGCAGIGGVGGLRFFVFWASSGVHV
jgi:hypothetical protein